MTDAHLDPPMLDSATKATVLSNERGSLRSEMIAIGIDLRRTVLVFLTVGLAAAGIYLGDPQFLSDLQRSAVVFALSQIEIFLTAYGMSMAAHQRVLAGYCAALEDQMNSLAGEELCVWESKVIPPSPTNRPVFPKFPHLHALSHCGFCCLHLDCLSSAKSFLRWRTFNS